MCLELTEVFQFGLETLINTLKIPQYLLYILVLHIK